MSQCMHGANVWWSEEARGAALRRYDVLDTGPEAAFDDLAALATALLDAPVAVINFIDRTRQVFKAEIGLGIRETPLDVSICVHAIRESADLFVVADLAEDRRFAKNPFVAGEPQARFYAGAILRTTEGFPVGTICVLDFAPRPQGLTPEQGRHLEALARAVMRELDLRIHAKLLQAALDTAETGIVIVEVDGRASVLNAEAARILGGSPDELFSRLAADNLDSEQMATRAILDRGRKCGRHLGVRHRRLQAGQSLFTIRDETRIRETEQALRERESQYQALAEALPQKVWIANARGTTVYCNARMIAYHGQVGSNLEERFRIFHPDDRARALAIRAAAAGDGTAVELEARLRRVDGAYRWHHVTFAPVRRDGTVSEWIGVALDIDDAKEAEAKIESQASLLAATLESMDQGLMMVDADDVVRVHNPRLLELLDLPPDLMRPGVRFSEVVAFQEAAGELAKYEGVLPEWATNRHDVRLAPPIFERTRPTGRVIEIRTVHREDGSAVRTYTDVSERKAAECKLFSLAWHDPLTGLPNRAQFQSISSKLLEEGDTVALLLLDLDSFKDVNDSLGHAAGDELLVAVAERLRAVLPPEASPARLSGDEFAILLPKATRASAEHVATSVLAALRPPFTLADQETAQRASVGVALFPWDASDAAELAKAADIALYAAKKRGRDQFAVFTPDLRDEALNKVHVLKAARDALAADAIVPFYQPKVCLLTGAVQGFEALLRWRHPDGGLRSPGDLWAALQDGQLSIEIGQRMLDRATSDMARWARDGVDFGSVALNASNAEFLRGDFAERLLRRLEELSLRPECLEVEITETVLIGASATQVSTTMAQLRGAGVALSLDDFGTGFASLKHLNEFPLDWIKMDRSFIGQALTSRKANAIIESMIQLASSLRIGVVAEGVEREDVANHLRDRGCDLAQGFLFAKPMAGERVPHFLRTWPGVRGVARPYAARSSA